MLYSGLRDVILKKVTLHDIFFLNGKRKCIDQSGKICADQIMC